MGFSTSRVAPRVTLEPPACAAAGAPVRELAALYKPHLEGRSPWSPYGCLLLVGALLRVGLGLLSELVALGRERERAWQVS